MKNQQRFRVNEILLLDKNTYSKPSGHENCLLFVFLFIVCNFKSQAASLCASCAGRSSLGPRTQFISFQRKRLCQIVEHRQTNGPFATLGSRRNSEEYGAAGNSILGIGRGSLGGLNNVYAEGHKGTEATNNTVGNNNLFMFLVVFETSLITG